MPDAIAAIRDLVGAVPVFGICLGPQLLGRVMPGHVHDEVPQVLKRCQLRLEACSKRPLRLDLVSPTLRRCGSRRLCRTIRRMATLTIRTDVAVEQALESLTRDGRSRSEATRAAILDAERAHRRNRLRAEAEELRRDPDDVAASRELAARMEAIRAW